MQRLTFAGLLAVALSAAACSKKEAPQAEASARPAAPKVGLENPANDANTTKLVTAVLAKCEFKTHGFSTTCEEWKKITKARELKRGAQDATLVNLLEDKNEKVRWVAANRLVSNGQAYTGDKALAERVLLAAERETSVTVGREIGRAAGRIRVKETDTKERLEKLAKGHKLPELRKGVVSKMLFNNKSEFFDVVAEMAKTEKHKGVRMAAVSAFWVGTPQGREKDTCKLWLGEVKDPKEAVSGEAAYLAAFFTMGGGCSEHWDELLTRIEGWAKDGKLTESRFASALNYLHKQKTASDAQKKKALAVAKILIENTTNGGAARGRALQFVGEADPGGAAYAKKYVDDKQFFVKSTAKRVIDKAQAKKK